LKEENFRLRNLLKSELLNKVQLAINKEIRRIPIFKKPIHRLVMKKVPFASASLVLVFRSQKRKKKFSLTIPSSTLKYY